MATTQTYPPEWESYADIANFYDRVRSALGLVSATDIANAAMDYPEKAPMAERSIKSRVTGWATLTEAQFVIFESCIVLQTAVYFREYASKLVRKMQKSPTLQIEYNEKASVSGQSFESVIDTLIADILGTSGGTVEAFRVTSAPRKTSWI